MFNKRNIILFLILFFVLSFVYRIWIFSNQTLTNGDWVYFLKETMSTLRIYYFSTWLGDGLGRFLIDASQAPTYAMYGVLAKYLNFDYSLSERLVHMWPILIFGTTGLFFLLNHFFKNRIAILVGIIVYMFNTYMLIYETGFLTLSVAIALIPLILFLFIKSLETGNLKWLFLTILVSFIQGAYEFREFYITSLILFSYLVFFVVFMDKKKWVKAIYYTIILFIFLGLSNIFWILPLFVTKDIAINSLLTRGLFGNEFTNVLYSFTLFHSFWTGTKLAVFNPQQIPSYFWLIPIFAFLGLLLNRKNKNILFFGFIALVGIFLTKQVGHPFSGVYPWLYVHFPGFGAFREASKFYPLIAIGYAVLIGGFVNWIWENWDNTKIKKYFTYIVITVITLIFVWNTKPFITGEIGTLFVQRNIPNDYLIVKDFILKQENYFRTLSAPRYSRWNIYTNIHPEISLIDIINSDWKSYINSKYSNTQKYFYAQAMLSLFNVQHANNLLDIGSIKYVYVPLEDKSNDDDFFVFYGKTRNYYIEELGKISWLHKINIGTRDIAVYENFNYRPHIYTTNNQESINNNQPFTKIDYRFVNPTEYKFSIKNVAEPFYLNFSESFHPQWSLRIGSFSWVDVLFSKNYFVDSKNHLRNDAGLNSFYIDPSHVCLFHEALAKGDKVGDGCVRNPDGSYDISGTLYFAPQSYMYLGLIISSSTMIIIFGYLGFIGFNSLKRKYERKNK